MDTEDDREFEQHFQEDQRRVYRGEYKHSCPDCGAPNSLTNEMKRRGYHCDRCTKQTEQGF